MKPLMLILIFITVTKISEAQDSLRLQSNDLSKSKKLVTIGKVMGYTGLGLILSSFIIKGPNQEAESFSDFTIVEQPALLYSGIILSLAGVMTMEGPGKRKHKGPQLTLIRNKITIPTGSSLAIHFQPAFAVKFQL